ncbi:RNA-binding protein [Giardia muris]|uniref:RNA-binding protein n=1 Tax=Giardia muris TaxID=5742 RepID=A0A4Z1SNY2_GIAMU|nr:RNA-binding protein [Giardia muris]|eukprot:TNJ26565.1 RNA-binding protein [Giardia muris]
MASVFVGNLSERVTGALLDELFSHVGRVTRVHVPVDPLSGVPLGYGFVDLQTDEMAEYAIKVLTGVSLYSQKLVLRRANAPEGLSPSFSSSPVLRLRPATQTSEGALRAWKDGVVRALGLLGEVTGKVELEEAGSPVILVTHRTTAGHQEAARRLSRQFFAGVETLCDAV